MSNNKEALPPAKKRGKGRPQATIDFQQFEGLCGFQCTQSEIASFFRIHKETLIRLVEHFYKMPFAQAYKMLSETGNCSLRRTQFALSKKNAQMAIHLGKIYLNQKEVIINKTEESTVQKVVLEIPDNGRRKVKNDSDT